MSNFGELGKQRLRDAVNASRCDPDSAAGFYESYFLRANHPSRPLAFWIRYTVFIPKGRAADAQGQLWGIYFDGETSSSVAIKQCFPLSACSFSKSELKVQLGAATLDGGSLQGALERGAQHLAWDLSYRGDAAPAFLLPMGFYEGGFPKAKVLSGMPLADFTGSLKVNDQTIAVDGWRGSQNHNWGSKHTDQYAWAQVAGFDNDPDAYLECSTVRLKIGPLWTPRLTNIVLRVGAREFLLNSLQQAWRNRGEYGYGHWALRARQGSIELQILIQVDSARFVGLAYDDPPGGTRTCLNTKLASCRVQLSEAGHAPVVLETMSRAAFEILAVTDDHGIAILA